MQTFEATPAPANLLAAKAELEAFAAGLLTRHGVKLECVVYEVPAERGFGVLTLLEPRRALQSLVDAVGFIAGRVFDRTCVVAVTPIEQCASEPEPDAPPGGIN